VSDTALVINCNFCFSHLDINYNTQPVFWHSNGDWISNYGSSPASCLSLLFRSTITFHYLCIVVDTHLCRSHLSCGWRWSHNKVNMLTNLCLQFSQMNWDKIRTLFNSEVCATLQSEFYILQVKKNADTFAVQLCHIIFAASSMWWFSIEVSEIERVCHSTCSHQLILTPQAVLTFCIKWWRMTDSHHSELAFMIRAIRSTEEGINDHQNFDHDCVSHLLQIDSYLYLAHHVNNLTVNYHLRKSAIKFSLIHSNSQ